MSSIIERPMGANEPADQNPLTDDEMQMLYKACNPLKPVVWKNASGSGSWDGQDVQDFICLSVYTGLRISDVAMFDTDERLQGNNIFIRAKKNNRRLFTWVPDFVRDRMLDRQSRFGSKIFQTGASARLDTVTDLWRRKLKRVYKLALKNGRFLIRSSTPIDFVTPLFESYLNTECRYRTSLNSWVIPKISFGNTTRSGYQNVKRG